MNLLLNLPIIALVMYSCSRVASGLDGGLAFYKLMAALGFLTVAIHSFFFIRGSEAFAQPVSIALLAATLVLSAWQLFALRGGAEPAALPAR